LRVGILRRSSPSGDVGGDLIDLAGDADKWVAYVADVSGHGVAPGVSWHGEKRRAHAADFRR